MRATLAMLSLVLVTLTGCGTCGGEGCGDFDDAAPGSHTATVMKHADLSADSDAPAPYIDETATFEYTGTEAILTYADEEGNIWEVRYTTTPMDLGA